MLISAQRTYWRDRCRLRPKARAVTDERDRLPAWLDRLLCRLGMHDFRLVEVVGGFGQGGPVKKIECRRCGYVATKQG